MLSFPITLFAYIPAFNNARPSTDTVMIKELEIKVFNFETWENFTKHLVNTITIISHEHQLSQFTDHWMFFKCLFRSTTTKNHHSSALLALFTGNPLVTTRFLHRLSVVWKVFLFDGQLWSYPAPTSPHSPQSVPKGISFSWSWWI